MAVKNCGISPVAVRVGRVLSEVSRKWEVIWAVFGKITDCLCKMDASPTPHPSLASVGLTRGEEKHLSVLALPPTHPPCCFLCREQDLGEGQGPQEAARIPPASATEMPVGPWQAQAGPRPGFRPPPRGSREEAYFFHSQERIQLGAGLFPKPSFLD